VGELHANRSRHLPHPRPARPLPPGWTDEQIREQVTFTPGRIIVAGGKVHRGKRKRLDYTLSFQPDVPQALVGGVHLGKGGMTMIVERRTFFCKVG
jgi:type I restriction enzyme R subunit